MTNGSLILTIGGGLSLALSILHIGMIFIGAPAYRYFDAGDWMVRQAEKGSLIPALLTLLVALVFAAFGAYAFSGSGLIQTLPLIRPSLIVIGSIYCLRGLLVILELRSYFKAPSESSPQLIAFSFTSLSIGIVYLMGIWVSWDSISTGSG